MVACCIYVRELDVVELLLNKGADVNARDDVRDNNRALPDSHYRMLQHVY